MVILAGYTREMETFLTANSGLASRFPNQIEFPDYTPGGAFGHYHRTGQSPGLPPGRGLHLPSLGYYKRRQALDSRTAGNGRLARNTLKRRSSTKAAA